MRGKSTSSKAAGIALSVSLSVAAVAAATTSDAGESQLDATTAVASNAMIEGREAVSASRSVHRAESAAAVKAPARKLSPRQRQVQRGKRLIARDRAALRDSRSVKRSTARALGRHLADNRGWDGRQWRCLDNLWKAESNWRPRANNGSSGAYGIPQALPGHKMSSHGRDWRLSARTQIRWGLKYIDARWNTPCGAYGHFQNRNWY